MPDAPPSPAMRYVRILCMYVCMYSMWFAKQRYCVCISMTSKKKWLGTCDPFHSHSLKYGSTIACIHTYIHAYTFAL